MQQYINTVQNRSGAAISSASVLVKTYPGAVNATIYSDDGVTEATNPLTTDANGQFTFYAADGRYSLTISKTGVITQRTIDDILLADQTRGTFTMDADASTSVTEAECTATSVIVLMPTNAAAATLVSGASSPYVTPGAGSFTVNTANAGNAAGTETFSYMILS